MFGNCNHCCFCCGHPCTMLGVSLSISCKNKIQCVCVWKKKKKNRDAKFYLQYNVKYVREREKINRRNGKKYKYRKVLKHFWNNGFSQTFFIL